MGPAGGLRSAAQSAARRRPDLALARLNWPADADPSPGCGGSTHPECARKGRLIEERMLSAGVARPAPPSITMRVPPASSTAGGWPAPTGAELTPTMWLVRYERSNRGGPTVA